MPRSAAWDPLQTLHVSIYDSAGARKYVIGYSYAQQPACVMLLGVALLSLIRDNTAPSLQSPATQVEEQRNQHLCYKQLL